MHRNRNPALHPFERAREYTKAIVATKLDKIFAKPFIGALDGHTDGVYIMSNVRTKNAPFISGACDGEIKIWDLTRRKCVWSTTAHTGFVRGIAPDVQGSTIFTCGDDKLIKQWALEPDLQSPIQPLKTILSPSSLTSIDHHWVDNQFATSGESVCVWDYTRAEPIHTYKWGADSVLNVRYNPAESCLLASTGSDRGVSLYDLRSSLPMRKFMLAMKSNMIAWNPREPFNFILACEDYNVYQFDMRNLDQAVMIHKDHLSAVMAVAFSPTGREFVSGSYDRTVRLFKVNSGHSREIYHAKRMQRVFSVCFSSDAQFVLSGSDDTNVRIWKAQASQALGVPSARQHRKQLLHDALKKRYAHMPEVSRITKDKKIPKSLKKAIKLRHEQSQAEKRKEDNRRKHSRSGDVATEPERKKAVIKQLE